MRRGEETERKIETTTIRKREGEGNGEPSPPVGTAATLVIPRLKASFNIYDLFRFNSTCKRSDAFIFSDVCALNRHSSDVCLTRVETALTSHAKFKRSKFKSPPPPSPLLFSIIYFVRFHANVVMIYIYVQWI